VSGARAVNEQSPRLLANRRSPELATSSLQGVLAVPIGATEQHGPHLPLSTDTDVAVALCLALAAARDDVIVAPALPYGSSGEHAGFPGTISIGQAALEHLVVELVRSATDSFPHVVLVSAHGGNAEPLERAVERLRAESRDVVLHLPSWPGHPHAGRPETSMLLALTPERVDMTLAAPGNVGSLEELWPKLRSGGVASVSANGILGDPTGANAPEGADLLESLATSLISAVDRWRTGVPA